MTNTMMEKLDNHFTEYQSIRNFIDWLGERDTFVCEDIQGNLIPIHNNECLIAEFFEIDLAEVENERRQLLATLQQKACQAPMREVPKQPLTTQAPPKVRNIKEFKDMMRSIKRSKK